MESSPVALIGLQAPTRKEDERGRVRLPLLSAYLDEQQRLSAVERFSLRHDEGGAPLQEKFYKELIPAGKPGSGQQYAFSVDLDKCTGCKACVTACRSMNGLDPGETWRAVGVLHGGSVQAPYQQTVTSACHHCADPGCMKGCPVGAYEKDPETGIVRHLDDQCIGCQYCTLTCPYEVPQYNERLGIVRKCDMCSDRLAVGEAPACVQACPNEAIAIRIVERAEIVAAAEAGIFLPTAPAPSITLPSTEYKTARSLPHNAVPADYEKVRPAAQHAPLIVTLVLTQLSFGAFSTELWLGRTFPGAFGPLRPYHALFSLAMGLLALVGSQFHLGRPHLAYRAILGIRTSWLSREILAFGAFAGLAVLYAASFWYGPILAMLGIRAPEIANIGAIQHGLALGVAGVGAVGVLCSALLYWATGRTFWNAPSTIARFFLSAIVQGLATTLLVSVAGGPPVGPDNSAISQALAHALLVATCLKLTFEASTFLHLNDRRHADLRRTARILVAELAEWTGTRFGAGAIGGIVLPFMISAQIEAHTADAPVGLAIAAFAFVLFGELSERALFFMGVSAPRMPGAVGAQ